MQVTINELIELIGHKEVELMKLRQRIAQIEKEFKDATENKHSTEEEPIQQI